EDGIRDFHVTGVQTCALPIYDLAFAVNAHTLRLVCRALEIGDQLIAYAQNVGIAYLTSQRTADRIRGFEQFIAELPQAVVVQTRSEERRVGKDCSTGRSPHY